MRTEINKNENLKSAVIESCINGTITIKVTVDRLGFSERYQRNRKHKKSKAHRKRLECPSSGELLQVNGTPYQFFYGGNKMYCLHGFINDATH